MTDTLAAPCSLPYPAMVKTLRAPECASDYMSASRTPPEHRNKCHVTLRPRRTPRGRTGRVTLFPGTRHVQGKFKHQFIELIEVSVVYWLLEVT